MAVAMEQNGHGADASGVEVNIKRDDVFSSSFVGGAVQQPPQFAMATGATDESSTAPSVVQRFGMRWRAEANTNNVAIKQAIDLLAIRCRYECLWLKGHMALPGLRVNDKNERDRTDYFVRRGDCRSIARLRIEAIRRRQAGRDGKSDSSVSVGLKQNHAAYQLRCPFDERVS